MIEEEFVKYVVCNLVDHPDDVKIKQSDDRKGVLLELTVNPEDLGRVIGHKGNTVQAIRSVLRALGTKNGQRYNLKVINTDEERLTESEEETKVNNDSNAGVENSTTEKVENDDDNLKKLRSDLADLRDSEL